MSGKDALNEALSRVFNPIGVSEVRIATLTSKVEDVLAEKGYYVAPIAQPTSPGVRNADPRTSGQAVPGVMRRGSQRHLLLRSYAERAPESGLTDEEAMERAVGVNPNSEYATRCSELRNAGWIEDTGEDRKGNSGTPRIVCRITDAGRAELRRLA
jgi:hypothetical protein